jgi:hypothetical protein
MTPIEGISDIRWFPRLGKIRLGIKKEGQRVSYPQAVDFFVCPEEVKKVHGEQPKELPVMFPADDIELIAPQWFKCYSYSQGLICRGDGKHCRRKVDTETGDFANKDTRKWVMTDGSCEPEHCPMIGSKQCRKMMSLLFILHEVPGLGVYQLDTSSFYSIVNMNSQLAPGGFLRQFTKGRIAFIPLILSVEPKEVNPPGEGRKTVHVLNVRAEVKLADIIRISRQRPSQVLFPTLEEEEPPEDLYPEGVLAEAEVIHEEEVPPEQSGEASATLAVAPPQKLQKRKPRAARPARPAVPSAQVPEEPPGEPQEDVVGPAEPGDEGLSIDWPWLNQTLQHIHWSEASAITWLAYKFPGINTQGKLSDVLGRLSREQAQEFLDEVQERDAGKQRNLFT